MSKVISINHEIPAFVRVENKIIDIAAKKGPRRSQAQQLAKLCQQPEFKEIQKYGRADIEFNQVVIELIADRDIALQTRCKIANALADPLKTQIVLNKLPSKEAETIFEDISFSQAAACAIWLFNKKTNLENLVTPERLKHSINLTQTKEDHNILTSELWQWAHSQWTINPNIWWSVAKHQTLIKCVQNHIQTSKNTPIEEMLWEDRFEKINMCVLAGITPEFKKPFPWKHFEKLSRVFQNKPIAPIAIAEMAVACEEEPEEQDIHHIERWHNHWGTKSQNNLPKGNTELHQHGFETGPNWIRSKKHGIAAWQISPTTVVSQRKITKRNRQARINFYQWLEQNGIENKKIASYHMFSTPKLTRLKTKLRKTIKSSPKLTFWETGMHAIIKTTLREELLAKPEKEILPDLQTLIEKCAPEQINKLLDNEALKTEERKYSKAKNPEKNRIIEKLVKTAMQKGYIPTPEFSATLL